MSFLALASDTCLLIGAAFCLIGGIGQNTTLVHGTPRDVDRQVKDAWQQVERLGLILGPGCVANRNAPDKNVIQLRKSVEESTSS